LERRNDEWWISFRKSNVDTALPSMPSEIVEAHLSSVVSDGTTIKGILKAVGGMFSDQSIYQSSYPLFGLAHALRATFARLGEAPGDVVQDRQEIATLDVGNQIDASVSAISRSMRRTYVEKGKLDEKTYELYFRAVSDILRAEFVGESNEDGSYFNHLAAQLVNLTPESYRTTHRTYLEYLTKITRKHFMDEMKKEL
jgi:hypothetical protein